MTNNRPVRSYCHPVDAKIIRTLDKPAVTAIFKKIISIETDLNWGPMLADAIPVTEKNFSWIHDIVTDCARTLNIPEPYVVISNSVNMNAYTLGIDNNAYIILGAPLVKVMEKHKKYLHFVVGHECGHIAMGHLLYNNIVNVISNTALSSLGNKASFFLAPVLQLALSAWSRRSEISADRAGLLCCGDLDAAQHALAQIEMGLLPIDNVDIDDYIKKGTKFREDGILRKLGELKYTHPLLPKRIQALDVFTQSEMIYRIVGLTPPEGAVPDKVMEEMVEEIVTVAKISKAKNKDNCAVEAVVA